MKVPSAAHYGTCSARPKACQRGCTCVERVAGREDGPVGAATGLDDAVDVQPHHDFAKDLSLAGMDDLLTYDTVENCQSAAAAIAGLDEADIPAGLALVLDECQDLFHLGVVSVLDACPG